MGLMRAAWNSMFVLDDICCGTLQGVSMSRRNEDEQSYFDR